MNNTQQEVIQQQQAFWNALQSKNASQLDRLLADDFLSLGRVNQAKSEFIQRLTSFPAEILGIEGDAMQVHVFGDIAVLTTVQIARLRLPDGNEIAEGLVTTNVFRHDTNGWRMVLAHPVSAGASDE